MLLASYWQIINLRHFSTVLYFYRTKGGSHGIFHKRHDCTEVHPQVSEIKAGMDSVVGVVKDNAENNSQKPAT
jgi:hypothetical protein